MSEPLWLDGKAHKVTVELLSHADGSRHEVAEVARRGYVAVHVDAGACLRLYQGDSLRGATLRQVAIAPWRHRVQVMPIAKDDTRWPDQRTIMLEN